MERESPFHSGTVHRWNLCRNTENTTGHAHENCSQGVLVSSTIHPISSRNSNDHSKTTESHGCLLGRDLLTNTYEVVGRYELVDFVSSLEGWNSRWSRSTSSKRSIFTRSLRPSGKWKCTIEENAMSSVVRWLILISDSFQIIYYSGVECRRQARGRDDSDNWRQSTTRNVCWRNPSCWLCTLVSRISVRNDNCDRNISLIESIITWRWIFSSYLCIHSIDIDLSSLSLLDFHNQHIGNLVSSIVSRD